MVPERSALLGFRSLNPYRRRNHGIHVVASYISVSSESVDAFYSVSFRCHSSRTGRASSMRSLYAGGFVPTFRLLRCRLRHYYSSDPSRPFARLFGT